MSWSTSLSTARASAGSAIPAIDVVERTTTHAITLGEGGNQGLADILSRYPDDTNRTATSSGGLIFGSIFGANEYHPQKIAQLLEGTPLTVRLVDFLVRFGEQIALDFMMNRGYHLKMLNKHISGFAQGVQARPTVRLAQVSSNSPRRHHCLREPCHTAHTSPPTIPLAPALTAQTSIWRKFKPTNRPTHALFEAFAAACAAKAQGRLGRGHRQ